MTIIKGVDVTKSIEKIVNEYLSLPELPEFLDDASAPAAVIMTLDLIRATIQSLVREPNDDNVRLVQGALIVYMLADVPANIHTSSVFEIFENAIDLQRDIGDTITAQMLAMQTLTEISEDYIRDLADHRGVDQETAKIQLRSSKAELFSGYISVAKLFDPDLDTDEFLFRQLLGS